MTAPRLDTSPVATRKKSGPSNRAPWPVWVGLGLCALTVAYPVAMIFLQSVFPHLDDGLLEGPLTPYRELLRTPGIAEMWQTSLGCAALTTLTSWVLGVPAGWLLGRIRLRGKTLIRVSLLLPVMAPPYLLALAYVLVFQPRGLFDTFIFPLPEDLRKVFFSYWGVVIVMSLTNFGTVALLVEAALQGISTRFEDAARCLSMPPLAVFRRITLPLLVPALANSGVLTFVDTLSNFGVAAILGPRSDLLLLPAVIYDMLTTWPVDVPLAAALSSLLAITSIALVTIARFCVAAKVLTNGRLPVNHYASLNFWQHASVWIYFAGIFVASSLIPTFTIFLMSIVDDWNGVRPTFTFQHYVTLFGANSSGLEALATSLLLSTGAATACVVIGGIVAYALARYGGLAAHILDHLSVLPRVIPNLVIAVALILAWNASWLPFRIYGTPLILLLAYIAIYQAVGLRFADAAMQQLSIRLEQAAACLGMPRPMIIIRIVLPMLAPSLFVAWVTISIMCLRDWVASIMLLPPDMQTVGSYIFSQFEQGDFSLAMAMAFCAVVLSTVVLVAANMQFYRKASYNI